MNKLLLFLAVFLVLPYSLAIAIEDPFPPEFREVAVACGFPYLIYAEVGQYDGEHFISIMEKNSQPASLKIGEEMEAMIESLKSVMSLLGYRVPAITLDYSHIAFFMEDDEASITYKLIMTNEIQSETVHTGLDQFENSIRVYFSHPVWPFGPPQPFQQ